MYELEMAGCVCALGAALLTMLSALPAFSDQKPRLTFWTGPLGFYAGIAGMAAVAIPVLAAV